MLHPDGTKTCPSCTHALPTKDFYRIRRAVGDGFSAYCKACTKLKAVDWQKKNPAKMQAKWDDDYAKEVEQKLNGTWPQERIDRRRAQAAAKRAADPEAQPEYYKSYCQKQRSSNPTEWKARHGVNYQAYRARQKGRLTDFKLADWRLLMARFGAKCAYCGAAAKVLDLDHIVPLALGGNNVVGNVVLACRPCNSHKSNRHPDEFCKDMGCDLLNVLTKAAIRPSMLPISDGAVLLPNSSRREILL